MLGHNNPPSDQELLAEELMERNRAIIERAAALLKAEERAPKVLETDEHASAVVEFIKQINTCTKGLEDARKREKEPFRVKAAAVDTFFKANMDALDRVLSRVRVGLDQFTKAKHAAEQRRLEEEAARQKREADQKAQVAASLEKVNAGAAELALEDALAAESNAAKYETAAVKTSGLTSVRSESGAAASLRTTWVGEIENVNALDLDKLRFLIPADALQKALNAYVRQGGRELKGAKIYEKTETVVK